jgi:hypothetical protein
LLHNQTTFQLKAVLLFREERDGEVRIVSGFKVPIIY